MLLFAIPTHTENKLKSNKKKKERDNSKLYQFSHSLWARFLKQMGKERKR